MIYISSHVETYICCSNRDLFLFWKLAPMPIYNYKDIYLKREFLASLYSMRPILIIVAITFKNIFNGIWIFQNISCMQAQSSCGQVYVDWVHNKASDKDIWPFVCFILETQLTTNTSAVLLTLLLLCRGWGRLKIFQSYIIFFWFFFTGFLSQFSSYKEKDGH